jgi:3D (Asp-Asp-Asp) domain-containing protein
MFDAPPVFVAQSTSYCQGSITATGDSPYFGEVAMNSLPLHTRITVKPRFNRRAHFVVLDHIGSGSELDFYTSSCTAALAWGRRSVHVTLGWRRPIRRGFVLRRRFVP